MNARAYPLLLSRVVLAAIAVVVCVLLVSPARADDRSTMRRSQHDSHSHYDRRNDHRRYENRGHRRHDSSRHWDSRHRHYYRDYGYRHHGYRDYGRHNAWRAPYTIELRSWPYHLSYSSGYRYSDSRWGHRYGRYYSGDYDRARSRYDYYRDCDDYDRRDYRDRWDADDWDD